MISLKERAIVVIVVLFMNMDKYCCYNRTYTTKFEECEPNKATDKNQDDNYSPGNQTEKVMVYFNVQSALLINPNQLDYSEYILVINLREEWMDPSLKSSGKKNIYLTNKSDQIWMPNFIIIDSFGQSKNVLDHFDQIFVQISSNGTVKCKKRIYVTIKCQKNLNLFTKYTGNCTFFMINYNKNDSLWWSVNESSFMIEEEDVKKQLVIKNRNCLSKNNNEKIAKYINKKNKLYYVCTKVTILFKDQFGFYLINIYIPISIIVITSWVPFWIDQKSVVIRLSLGSSSLISMIKCKYSISNLYFPEESEAMELWTNVCLTFVSGALIELLLIKFIPWSSIWLNNNKKSKQLEPNAVTMDISMDDNENGPNSLNTEPSAEESSLTTFRNRLRKSIVDLQSIGIKIESQLNSWKSKFITHVTSTIDVISRIAFPVLFVLFNVYYWSTYINNESYSV